MFMTKLIAITIFFITSTANASLFDSMMTSDFPENKNAGKYKVDVYGFDMRVYEFIPKNAPDHVCIAAFSGGDSKSFQMECVLRTSNTK